MRKTIYALVFVALSSTAVHASTYVLKKMDAGVVPSLRAFISKYAARGFGAWFDQALRCNKPNTWIYQVPGAPDGTGTYCNTNGKIHPFNAGVNYGLIDRLKSVGVPVDWLRSELADPMKLKAAYELIGADVIHSVVLSSIRSEYAPMNVYADHADDPTKVDYSTLDDYAAEYLKGFIRRRMLEAKPKDRSEIARLWGEILNEQVSYLLTDDSLVPEIKKKKN